jgi:homocysteine S-methyltransferase
MKTYRSELPQLGDGLFLADGGIETTLIFHNGLDLPDFAAFHVLKTPAGEVTLREYFRAYVDLAKQYGTGLVLESVTWRSNSDWGARIGYSLDELDDVNRKAIQLLEEIRREHQTKRTPIVVSGCVGPRGDGYVPGNVMSAQEAENYHQHQIEIFAKSSADLVTAITMNYVEEAIGIAKAAKNAGIPVVLSFTVETDGNLPTGQTLKSGIEQVDRETGGYPAYYMINCAHPTHFEHVVSDGGGWLQRIRGIRANASQMSHAELNEAPELDAGNPIELGMQYARLKQRIPTLSVMGGCCGTDHRHIEKIAAACLPLFQPASGFSF